MNIFELAELELIREGKINNKNAFSLMLDRAITIRKYLDIQARNKKVAKNRYLKKN